MSKREIKFRVFTPYSGMNELQVVDLIDIKKWNPPLMQFTGLLDKNGKEIFEGDIVLRSISGSFSTGLFQLYREPKTLKIIAQVQWNKWCWALFGENQFYSGLDPIVVKNVEVIGNIHENSELLGKKKDVVKNQNAG